MSEGGLFSWNLQKVKNNRGPAADYSTMSLPPPPPDHTWHPDPQTKEYKLVASNKEPIVPQNLQHVPGQPQATGGGGAAGLAVDFAQEHGDASERSDDWDLLSDRVSRSTHHSNSNHTSNNEPVFVPKAGSVRSINTLENESSQNHSRRGSFKIQRTHSNSTIDSTDQQDLGPSGKGVLGVDYLEHIIMPTDTLQGICLAYKISSTRLRQANHFSGQSLLLAPKKLVIPISKKALKSGFIREQDTNAKEYKIYSFLAEFPKMGMTEAKAYLELADWDLKAAVQSCKEDVEWEQEMEGPTGDNLKAGEIRITSTMNGNIKTQGAGIFRGPAKDNSNKSASRISSIVSRDEEDDRLRNEEDKKPQRSIVYAPLPAIATKTVQLQDVINAAPQHANYGVELKPISVKYSRKN